MGTYADAGGPPDHTDHADGGKSSAGTVLSFIKAILSNAIRRKALFKVKREVDKV